MEKQRKNKSKKNTQESMAANVLSCNPTFTLHTDKDLQAWYKQAPECPFAKSHQQLNGSSGAGREEQSPEEQFKQFSAF